MAAAIERRSTFFHLMFPLTILYSHAKNLKNPKLLRQSSVIRAKLSEVCVVGARLGIECSFERPEHALLRASAFFMSVAISEYQIFKDSFRILSW